MKPVHTHHRQRGFFDLGIGIGLMILFSGTAAVVTQNNSTQNDTVQQISTPVVQVVETVNRDQE